MANEQVHISRVSLWPFWVAARVFVGAFLIYFVSLVVVVFLCLKTARKSTTALG